jgi:SAM-dependent methyltransferase
VGLSGAVRFRLNLAVYCFVSAALAVVGPAWSQETQAKPRRKPDVGFYPTTQDVVEKMLTLAKVTKRDHVCDLGCGDGRFLLTAAKQYGCRATGYDLDPKLVAQGQAQAREMKLDGLVRIEERDIFTVDVSTVTVMMLFLLPDMNAKLIPQLQKMAPGSRVLTHEFDIPGIQPDQELTWVSKQDNSEHLIYIYSIPLKPRKP